MEKELLEKLVKLEVYLTITLLLSLKISLCELHG
jgi:hypothetical protein